MKIKVKKEAMLASLQKVQSVINPRNTLAVLANVLFRAQDGKLELTATDMALTLRTTMEAEVLQPGSTTIPAKRILGVFRELAVAEVELEVNDQNITLIHAGSSHFKIHGISENEYPNLPELADAKTYTLDQGDSLRLDLALLAAGAPLSATTASGKRIALTHDLTGNEIAIIKAGGLLNYVNDRQK